MTPQDEYIANQARWLESIGGLEPGDKLLVMAKAEDYQCGWGADWAEDMNRAVGKVATFHTGENHEPIGDYGIRLKYGDDPVRSFVRSFPFFILSKQDKDIG